MPMIINIEEYDQIFREKNNLPHTILNTVFKKQSIDLVSNVKTKMAAMMINNEVWPLTINQKEYHNALICSPYTTYVTYPLGELKHFKKKWIKCAILLNAVLMSALCRATKVNQCVQLNNNLNSLINHSTRFADVVPSMTKKLITAYPKHAITIFRLNEELDKNLLETLAKNGYCIFPDRSTHVYFPDRHFEKRTDTKNDFQLLKRTDYTLVSHDELLPTDAKRFANLYSMLFIDKHSKLNPIYTEEYFKQAIIHHWHHYTALRNKEGRIDAFLSWVVDDEKQMYCGPMGYDTSVDMSVGLYRMSVAIYLKHAFDNQYVFNMGGGSDQFKLNRGSTSTLEYTAVYCQHLSLYRQIPWKVFTYLFNKLVRRVVAR